MTDPDLNHLEQLYRDMPEPELMDVGRRYDEFTSDVQTLIRAEFARRSLEPPLVYDEPEEDDESRHPPLVTVAQYRDASEAFVARALLQSAGIPCFLQDENTIRMDWLWSNLIGGMRLRVAGEDEAVARVLLSQTRPDPLPLQDGAEFVQPVCPKCGSKEIVLNDRMLKPAAAALLITGVPLLPSVSREEVWRCLDCGCIWQDEDETATA